MGFSGLGEAVYVVDQVAVTGLFCGSDGRANGKIPVGHCDPGRGVGAIAGGVCIDNGAIRGRSIPLYRDAAFDAFKDGGGGHLAFAWWLRRPLL